MDIKNIDDVMEEHSDGTKHVPFYAFPGGYQIIYITRDGGVLCAKCVEDNLDLIRDAKKDNDPQWDVIGYDIYYEGPTINCDNCNDVIESEYGDPDSEEE